MIAKLRKKLVVAAMASLLAVLLVVLGSVACLYYWKILSDADSTLLVLAQNGGFFPEMTQQDPLQRPHDRDTVPPKRPDVSPELPFETRYFFVTLDAQGNVGTVNTGKIAAVDTETAIEYGRAVWEKGREKGFWGSYRYMRWDAGAETMILFLDCGRSLDSFSTLLSSCILVSAAGSLLVLLLLVLLSGRIVKPFSESYEKQKRFITDAGHELKTPLTIIDANAEILTMDFGENEWIQEIQAQTKRLSNLTGDLILLSRMEEPQPARTEEFSLSELAQQAVQSFQGVARAQGKSLEAEIQPELCMRGDSKAVQKLLTILLDNALKYALPGTGARCSLRRQKNQLVFAVYNPCEPITKEQTSHLFDRFYRTDSSRNSQTGGYGLGLSIAQAITAAHRGRISASTADGASLTITVKLPV